MVNPVPTRTSTINPFGARGRLWSCRRNAAGHGIHTGIDLMAPRGARVVAARPGVARHVNYGVSAFGPFQVAVFCADGTLDFYAHMQRRVGNGTSVGAGDWLGEVSDLGNAIGTHLHFERHRNQRGWTCDVQVDPAPSINWQPPGSGGSSGSGNRPLPPPTPPKDDPVTPQEIERIVNGVWARAPWPRNADGLPASSAANNLGHASVNAREVRANVRALAAAEADRYTVATGRFQHIERRLDRLTAAIEALERKL